MAKLTVGLGNARLVTEGFVDPQRHPVPPLCAREVTPRLAESAEGGDHDF